MQPKQLHPCRPSVDIESNATPRARRYQSNHPTSLHPRVISVGPWGGPGGQPFRMRGTSVPHLRAIIVYHSNVSIHALACEYSLAADDEDANGEQRVRMAGPWGIPHSIGSRRVRFTIEMSAGEYLTAVEGTTGHFGDSPGVVVVTSLTFRTSRGKTYGPYGGSGTGTATPFSVPAASGCIVGFWGHSGRLLDAIGVYIKPSAPTLSYNYPYPETGMKVTVSNKTFVFPEVQ